MDFKQVYDFTNETVKEVLGETAVVNEDLSNIVDIGTQIFNANALDKYVNALVDSEGLTQVDADQILVNIGELVVGIEHITV